MAQQLAESPKRLQEVARVFADLSKALGVEPVVTRVWDKVKGESGVHPDKRAIDFRDQYTGPDGKPRRLYTEDEVQYLVSSMNTRFPRKDGYPTCLHHGFQGGPEHFHCQIPRSWVGGQDDSSGSD